MMYVNVMVGTVIFTARERVSADEKGVFNIPCPCG